MNLLNIEMTKIRRSRIIWILLIPIVLLWISAVINADMNFEMQAEGISPEDNFFIQSFMGFAWFMFPASLVVSTVLLIQTERKNHGILKMLSLPLDTGSLCAAKFLLLLLLAAMQMAIMTAVYYLCAAVASALQDYSFTLPFFTVLKSAGLIYLASVPMAAFYWLLAVCIRTPIFSVGVGLATIVPSVLVMNTKLWFLYPMCYPFRIITSQMHEMATKMGTFSCDLFPWIPAAVIITFVSLGVACIRFGREERR